jgi:hypothetical protein
VLYWPSSSTLGLASKSDSFSSCSQTRGAGKEVVLPYTLLYKLSDGPQLMPPHRSSACLKVTVGTTAAPQPPTGEKKLPKRKASSRGRTCAAGK